ncbi:sulfotransferase [Pseudooceanicola marinus]|nr:sulfotransferase [Pseudooceanicola marinus]
MGEHAALQQNCSDSSESGDSDGGRPPAGAGGIVSIGEMALDDDTTRVISSKPFTDPVSRMLTPSPAVPRPTILYIAGYSRAGSTMLDMVLGRHGDIASTGELVYLLDDAPQESRICTCGARFGDCPVYGGWLETVPDIAALKTLQREIESRDGLEALKAGRVPEEKAAAYRDYAVSLYTHIAETTGARIILDSSKSAKDAAGRPLALARLAGFDVKVLHLSRDPRATIRSYIDKGSNWVLEGYRKPRPLESWRPIMGWTYANRIATDLAADFGDDYLHLRYEDFIADPGRALQAIGALAGTDLSEVARAVVEGDPFLAGHNVGGNRNRLEPQKIILKTPEPARLPLLRELALRAVSGSTPHRLGY